jgi:hypothetical protein
VIYEIGFFMAVLLLELLAVLLLQKHISVDEWRSLNEEVRHLRERNAAHEAQAVSVLEKVDTLGERLGRYDERLDLAVGTLGQHEGRIIALEAADG